jgi:hypothetical protein
MKGLNVKKLVALGVGAALIGAAVAPLASAQNLERGDVVNTTTGNALHDVVFGANSQGGDALWAANIATALGRLSFVETTGTVAADGSYTGTISIGGGQDVLSDAGSYNVDTNTVNTATGALEFSRAKYTASQLDWLLDKTYTQTLNNTTFTANIKEEIHVNADIKFDYTRLHVGDLVMQFTNVGDFNYTVSAGNGPLVVLDQTATNTADFSDTSADHINIPWLGEEYSEFSVSTTGTKPSETVNYVRLSKTSNQDVMVNGEERPLMGINAYAGQNLTLKLAAVTQTSNGGDYTAQWIVKDEEGNIVASQNVSSGSFLNDVLRDSSSQLLTNTGLYVSTVTLDVSQTPNVGSVTLLAGGNVIELRGDTQYPYNASDNDTSDDRWKVQFGPHLNAGTPDVNAISTISLINNNIGAALRDSSNPLHPKGLYVGTANASLKDFTDKGEFGLLAGEADGLDGKDYVIVRFDGWRTDNIRSTNLSIGGSVGGTAASSTGVRYIDNTDFEHKVPFYFSGSLTTSSSSFVLDQATFYYRVKVGDTAGDTSDVNFIVGADTNTVNGQAWTFNTGNADLNLTGALDLNLTHGAADINFGLPTVNFDANGVNLWCTRTSMAGGELNCSADWNLQIITNGKNNFSTAGDGDFIGTANYANSYYLDDGNLINKSNRAMVAIPLTSSTGMNTKTYRYVPYANEAQGRMYLLLSADNGGQEITETQNNSSYRWRFDGSDVREKNTDFNSTPFYWPDLQELPAFEAATTANGQNTTKSITAPSGDGSNTDYFVARFSVDTNKSNTYNAFVYVDTATGKLVDFQAITTGSGGLSNYTVDVNFHNGSSNDPTHLGGQTAVWNLSDRTDVSVLAAGYDDYGTKLWVKDKVFHATFPDQRMNTKTTFYGSRTTVTTTEATEVTYTCEAGDTSVVVTLPDGSTQTQACPGAAAAVGSTTRTYSSVPVQVRLDTDAFGSAGPHIIVGGHLVNTLAEGVVLGDGRTSEEALTSSGDSEMQVLSNGDVFVAGWTAADTATAARQLVSLLESLA